MADLFSMLTDLFSSDPPPEVLGRRIQQSLQVILAGLDERDILSTADMETLRRELRMLLKLERIQIAAAEMDKSEQVLQYMLRPSMEDCRTCGSASRSRPIMRLLAASVPTWTWHPRGTTTTGR